MSTLQYAFVGCGNMGQAMAKCLLDQKICSHKALLGIDPNSNARQAMQALGISTHPTAPAALGAANLLVLAIKPQNAQEVCVGLHPWLGEQQPVMSILAGVRSHTLTRWLGQRPIIRVMPNTPAQIGQGMSVYYANQTLTPPHQHLVHQLLEANGRSLGVEQEAQLDAATAVSGSGPAYAFFLAEHWVNAAQALGFNAQEAKQLVQQSLLGAAMLWQQQNVDVTTLRQQISSKGGTTEAALAYFQEKNLGNIIQQGIRRAFLRSQKLGLPPKHG